MRNLVLIVLLSSLAIGCGSTTALESSAPSEPVSVDASLMEWAGKLHRIDSDNVSVGVQNDGEFLYVSLSTRDPLAISQFMQQGLILWIDPAGGKGKTFGLRHPVGIMGNDATARQLSGDMAANRVRIERSMQDVVLIGADGKSMRRSKDAVPGIELQAEAGQRVFTYEAKVPLASGEGILYAIGTEPGREIGVGFATPEWEGQNLAQQPGRGGLPAGSLSSADGRSRYDRMRGANAAAAVPVPISYWTTVTLSPAN